MATSVRPAPAVTPDQVEADGPSSQGAIRRRRPFGRPLPIHLFLLSAVPTLALWAGNAADIRSFYPMRVAIGSVILALLISTIVLVVQRDIRRAGMTGSLAALVVLTGGYVLTDPTRAGWNLTIGAVAIVGIAVVASRLSDGAVRATTILLNVVSLALVSANGIAIYTDRPGSFAVNSVVQGAGTAGRDVWYLVPDRLPSQATLESMGFDVAFLFDGLRQRGFDIVENAQANYPQTSLSLASSWGLDYLVSDPRETSVGESLARLEDPLIGRLFDDAGYDYVHLGSWPAFSAESRSADTVLTLQGAGEFWTAWEATSLIPSIRFLLDSGTPASVAYARQVEHASHQLDQLTRLAATEPQGPQFILSHLVLPHGPYIYDEDGDLRPRTDNVSDVVGYQAQLTYFGRRLLDLIDVLQRRPDPPVIVIMSDEGLYPEDLDETLETGAVDPSTYDSRDVRHKMSILAAVADPDNRVPQLPPGTTAVNVTRAVVSHALSIDLPPLEDRSFKWTDGTYAELVEIPRAVFDTTPAGSR